ncbi:MAG: STAS domain-containing protein [Moorea sp. SIO2B7]|nr:STAS domain-containing protein [Moorena sp. SIO2B7]
MVAFSLFFQTAFASAVVKVVEPHGILDGTTAGQFKQEITNLVQSNVDIVLIDFTHVTFMDSSGLEALVLGLKTVRTAGGQLFICRINEQVRMLFELTSMDRVLEVFESREAFENSIAALQ